MVTLNPLALGSKKTARATTDDYLGDRSRRLWRRFVHWLTEPIPFPGKWPVNADGQKGYNSVSRHNS